MLGRQRELPDLAQLGDIGDDSRRSFAGAPQVWIGLLRWIGFQRAAKTCDGTLTSLVRKPGLAGRHPSARRLLDLENFAGDDDLFAEPQRLVLHQALDHVDAAVGGDSVTDALLDRQRNERRGIDVAAKHRRVDAAMAKQPRFLGSLDHHEPLLVFEPFDRFDFRDCRGRCHAGNPCFLCVVSGAALMRRDVRAGKRKAPLPNHAPTRALAVIRAGHPARKTRRRRVMPPADRRAS